MANRFLIASALAAGLVLAATEARADSTPGAATQLPPDTHPCAPTTDPPGQDSLSDKLADCRGVLRPSVGMDRDIYAPAPDPTPNSTPVIRPPITEAVPK
jgi:hypothetical protein